MSKANSLGEKLEKPDKGFRDATGVLGKLFSVICRDLGVTESLMNDRIQQYINNPVNGVPADNKARSSERGNIMKDLAAPDMTWKKFLKFLRIMTPKHVRFEVHLGWRNNLETVHSLRVDMAHLKEYGESVIAASEETEERD